MHFYRKKKITLAINKKLKKIHKKRCSYIEKQEEIKILLKNIYLDSNKYSIEDITQRKIYLQTKLDNQSATMSAMGLSIIVWFALELSRQALLAYASVDVDINSFVIPIFLPFFALGFCSWSSYYLGRLDKMYRIHNLIDFELAIIDSILEQHFSYSKIVNDIISSYADTLRSPLSSAEPLVLFNEKNQKFFHQFS